MRLLIATSHRNMVGGVEKYLQEILPHLAQRGHELALLYEYRFDPGRERIDPLDLDIPSLGIHETGEDAGLRFVHDWKPDVVYSQGLEATGLQSALLSEYPTVLYAHNYVGTCASGEKCHSFPNPQPCDRQFGPACLVLYHPRRCGGLHPGTMWKMYQRAAERNAQLPQYAAVLVASAHMRREYERHGVQPEKIHLAALPNPHEGEEFRMVPRTASRGNLLFLGRLTKLKGAAELLRAIPLAEKKLGAPLSIIVAGDGPEREHLQEFARQSSLSAEFTGWVGSAQKADLIAKSDLLVVPSLWPEPFGLVGIEAGTHGLPAAAYDVGGISDWLIPGYSGELAPGHPPTVEGLADAIRRALSDPSHYADLCRGAREVAGRFTLAAHVSKLEDTLETILETTPRKPAGSAPAGYPGGEEAIHADA
jgi:glycosyltransferase involved in cell wall biosynthesis